MDFGDASKFGSTMGQAREVFRLLHLFILFFFSSWLLASSDCPLREKNSDHSTSFARYIPSGFVCFSNFFFFFFHHSTTHHFFFVSSYYTTLITTVGRRSMLFVDACGTQSLLTIFCTFFFTFLSHLLIVIASHCEWKNSI